MGFNSGFKGLTVFILTKDKARPRDSDGLAVFRAGYDEVTFKCTKH
jgi:hypothetical protein